MCIYFEDTFLTIYMPQLLFEIRMTIEKAIDVEKCTISSHINLSLQNHVSYVPDAHSVPASEMTKYHVCLGDCITLNDCL